MSLHPRIITTASASIRSNYTAFDASGSGGRDAATRQRLPAAALSGAASDAMGAAARPAPHPAPRLTSVVRRYHTPSPFLQPAAAGPLGPAGPASTTAPLEFTIRARGEYMPLFGVRTNAVRAPMAGPAGGGVAAAAVVTSAVAASAPAAAAASAIAPPLAAAAAAVENGVLPRAGNERGSSGGQSNDLSFALDGGLQLLPGLEEGQGGEGGADAATRVRQEVWFETYALELLEPPQVRFGHCPKPRLVNG